MTHTLSDKQRSWPVNVHVLITQPTRREVNRGTSVRSNNVPVFRVLFTRNHYSGIQIRASTAREDITISCYITYTNHFT